MPVDELLEVAAIGDLACLVQVDEAELEYTGAPRVVYRDIYRAADHFQIFPTPSLGQTLVMPTATPPKFVWMPVLPSKIREALDNGRLLKGQFIKDYRSRINIRLDALYVAKEDAERFWGAKGKSLTPPFRQVDGFIRVCVRGYPEFSFNKTQAMILAHLHELRLLEPATWHKPVTVMNDLGLKGMNLRGEFRFKENLLDVLVDRKSNGRLVRFNPKPLDN